MVRELPRTSIEAKVCFDLVPGNGLFVGVPHLDACLLSSTNVRHVLGEFDKSVQIVGIDHRGDPSTPASEVDRLMSCPRKVDDGGELFACV